MSDSISYLSKRDGSGRTVVRFRTSDGTGDREDSRHGSRRGQELIDLFERVEGGAKGSSSDLNGGFCHCGSKEGEIFRVEGSCFSVDRIGFEGGRGRRVEVEIGCRGRNGSVNTVTTCASCYLFDLRGSESNFCCPVPFVKGFENDSSNFPAHESNWSKLGPIH